MDAKWYLLEYRPDMNSYGGSWKPIPGVYDSEESALEAGAEYEEATEHETAVSSADSLYLFGVIARDFE